MANVVVHIVTFNSASTIVPTIRAALHQHGFTPGANLQIVVTDNASEDGTADVVQAAFGEKVVLIRNEANTGFTGAHNCGPELLKTYSADYLLLLNPDLRLDTNALRALVDALEQDSRAGCATPRLYRADNALEPVKPLRFDAAGMVMTASCRHFDRGSEQYDAGQYSTDAYVFGGSGACLLISRTCLNDALLKDPVTGVPEFFDGAFFAYREDADFAWRLQWLGWKCRYVASAIGYHKRVVLPERRKKLPAELNAYSVRNRFLMQANNFSLGANGLSLLPTLARNAVVVAAACTVERSSFKALREAAALLPRALRRRSALNARRRVRPVDVSRWFSKSPFEPNPDGSFSESSRNPYTEPALSGARSTPITSIQAVVINYNSGQRLHSCLRALAQATRDLKSRLRLTVTVIDNASQDESARRLETLFAGTPEISIELLDYNSGFAGAIAHACADTSADAILILNPDLEITADAIVELVQALETHAQLGAVAPVFKDAAGNVQTGFTAKNFPTLGSTLCELFFLHRLWPQNPWTARFYRDQDPFTAQYLLRAATGTEVPHEPQNLPLVVDQPPAACLCVRTTAYRAVNGFDQQFWPAWFEDVDFCRRLRVAGYLAAIVGTAEAIHEGGYSKEFLGNIRFAEIWYPNLLRYWRKHGTAVEQAVLMAVLPLALVLRAAVALVYVPAGSTGSSRAPLALAFLRLARDSVLRTRKDSA